MRGRVFEQGETSPLGLYESGILATCPSLPSSEHAAELWRKRDPKVLGFITLDVLFRGALIGAGIALTGERDFKTIAKHGLAGSLVVEAFVLSWIGLTKRF